MPKSIYPAGATNANWFSMFNAVSFQITLGSPMILYAKSIGATATVLGIIAALTPLLTIAQIPAARLFGAQRLSPARYSRMGDRGRFSSLSSPLCRCSPS